MTQPQSDRDRASIATRGSGRPALGMGRPRGSRMGHPIGSVFMDRLFKRSVQPPFNAVGTPCSAWPSRAGQCGVTRPVARANRNAVTGALDDGYLSGASPDALTHLGQALMH